LFFPQPTPFVKCDNHILHYIPHEFFESKTIGNDDAEMWPLEGYVYSVSIGFGRGFSLISIVTFMSREA
jgi:hypothetical protein